MKNNLILTVAIIGLPFLIAGCSGTDEGGTSNTSAPEITSVSPTAGPAGTAVTIEGSGFSASTSGNTVTFNGTQASVSSASSGRIKARVPEGATSGPVKVRVGGETATGPSFNILSEESKSLVLFRPLNDAIDVELHPNFTWGAVSNSDDNPITYRLDLDSKTPPEVVAATGLTETFFNLEENLDYARTYSWKVVADNGQGEKTESEVFSFTTRQAQATHVTTDAGFTPRRFHSSVVFDNKLWVIGGDDGSYTSDVWYSSDGETWTQATADAGFPGRSLHTSVVYDERLWVIGGYSDSGVYNDVWYSSDGMLWTEATGNAAFTPRSGHTSVVFNDRIWVIGGYIYDGAYIPYNDVWNSTDGETWEQVTNEAAFPPRWFHTSVVFDDRMWVIDGATAESDVWYSNDGVLWTEATGDADFSSRQHLSSVAFDDKLWIIGGLHGRPASDVWYSSDGEVWMQATGVAGFPPRFGHTSVVFDGKPWIISGFDGTNRINDIWYLD